MTLAFWLMAAALPLAAQPKLCINAKVDTRSAAAGLEREFRTLLTAEPEPAWIGYTVPAARGVQLGCELVSPGGWYAPGVIHLEPPDHAVILYRVEAGHVLARAFPRPARTGVLRGRAEAVIRSAGDLVCAPKGLVTSGGRTHSNS